ncbi:unnamed protein product [Paramecium octaurelia]|uniref:Uncharacterized protein n=1 Tax=Paramecium octaurelia TaxID=43137 RepID=A0A8S1V065_PAROT|nr:unnamed protein product [Paramecium octaurelia]
MPQHLLKSIIQKGLLKNSRLFRNYAPKTNDEIFFNQYDQTFMTNSFVQDCLKQQKLKIPVDFFKESRFDDFAEDLNDLQVTRSKKQQ